MVQSNIIQDRLQELFPVHYRNGNILMINADCMEVMKHIKDNEVELSCVDPPYGIDVNMNAGRKAGEVKKHQDKEWDSSIPDDEYFIELFRVSKNQIIWGGNYFPLPLIQSWVFWDKQVPHGVSFSDGELAWTSFGGALKKTVIPYSGFQGSEGKIHPTQKPVALYKWLLSRYAKPGDKIIDTHGGSGSICIACHDLGYDLTWMELDEDYYKAACERYQNHAAQCNLFDQKTIEKTEQGTLF